MSDPRFEDGTDAVRTLPAERFRRQQPAGDPEKEIPRPAFQDGGFQPEQLPAVRQRAFETVRSGDVRKDCGKPLSGGAPVFDCGNCFAFEQPGSGDDQLPRIAGGNRKTAAIGPENGVLQLFVTDCRELLPRGGHFAPGEIRLENPDNAAHRFSRPTRRWKSLSG